jgi:hypothetical protein
MPRRSRLAFLPQQTTLVSLWKLLEESAENVLTPMRRIVDVADKRFSREVSAHRSDFVFLAARPGLRRSVIFLRSNRKTVRRLRPTANAISLILQP